MIRLYTKKRLEKDLFLYGSFYLYNLWIFTFRLNPMRVISGTNGRSWKCRFQEVKKNKSKIPGFFGINIIVDPKLKPNEFKIKK